MKWYGKNYQKTSNFVINSAKYRKNKIKKNALFFRKKFINTNFKLYLYIPSIWDFLIFKTLAISCKKIIFFYSNFYFFYLPIFSNHIITHYSTFSNVFTFTLFFKNNFINLFWNNLKIIFYSFSKIFFKKLKFKGKGYYIYKNKRNVIALQFGYSHVKRLFLFYTYVKFLSKTSIIIFGLNTKNITKTSLILFNIRPINIFTGKGVRFTRQIIYRKTGKISSYR